jgi:hypothetical protein
MRRTWINLNYLIAIQTATIDRLWLAAWIAPQVF